VAGKAVGNREVPGRVARLADPALGRILPAAQDIRTLAMAEETDIEEIEEDFEDEVDIEDEDELAVDDVDEFEEDEVDIEDEAIGTEDEEEAEDEEDEESDEALDELEAEELELIDEEVSESLLVDEVAELRAIRREELTMNVDAQAVRAGEFVCQSCFLVKRTSQLANRKKMICTDCAS
jgi:hypothetical protein